MKKLFFLTISMVLLLVLAGQPHPGHAVKAAQPLSFNGDFAADLVIGVPSEAIGSNAEAGAAHILYGAAGDGLSASGSQLWYQGNNGLLDAAEASDKFGSAFAIGDFDGNGYADLAVGVPWVSPRNVRKSPLRIFKLRLNKTGITTLNRGALAPPFQQL